MPRRSRQLDEAYELRDLIVDAIIEYQEKNKSVRVVLNQEYTLDTPARASIGQLSLDIVARDGTHKATTYRSLKE